MPNSNGTRSAAGKCQMPQTQRLRSGPSPPATKMLCCAGVSETDQAASPRQGWLRSSICSAPRCICGAVRSTQARRVRCLGERAAVPLHPGRRFQSTWHVTPMTSAHEVHTDVCQFLPTSCGRITCRACKERVHTDTDVLPAQLNGLGVHCNVIVAGRAVFKLSSVSQ